MTDSLQALARKSTLLRRAYRWWTDVHADLRLYGLTLAGYVPSHRFRRAVYGLAGMQFAPTSSLHWRARFFAPEHLSVAGWTTIGNDAFLDAREGISIGSSVNIAGEVRIYTREHDVNAVDFAETGGPVVLEDYVYVGTRVTILPGVRIGEGAVIASGAVVTTDVQPYVIAGGVPARPIGERSRDLNYRLGYAKRFQ